jgi:predicted dehydrogenase
MIQTHKNRIKECDIVGKKISWGVLGTARIAEKALIPAILNCDTAILEAVASRNIQKAARFESLFRPRKTYHTYDQLLTDPQIEAVYIPLPNALHKEWAVKALKAGKHVLCEKPLALEQGEAKEMYLEAAKQGKILVEAFAYLHNPLIDKIREVISEGVLGDIQYITSSFSFDLSPRKNDIRWSRNLGGGAVYDLGCYPISLIRYLMRGEITLLNAKATLHPSERTDLSTFALLRIDDRTIASVFVSFEQPKRAYFEIQGKRGILYTDHPFNEEGSLDYVLIDGKGTHHFSMESPNNYELEIRHFDNRIIDAAPPKMSVDDSVYSAGILTSILSEIGYGR